MDKIMNIIDKLAVKAHDEVLPQFSIADDVMTRIGLMKRNGQGLLPLELFAGVTAVAATIVLFFSLQALQTLLNPMYQLLAPNQGVTLW
ncbi:MAG: hypothetical protein ABFD79_17010 [Phycisphaerales bacterium]